MAYYFSIFVAKITKEIIMATKAQKEETRRKMMWVALYAMIGIMCGIMGLVYLDKSIADLGLVAGAFFTALAGVNGASLFSKPSAGADD